MHTPSGRYFWTHLAFVRKKTTKKKHKARQQGTNVTGNIISFQTNFWRTNLHQTLVQRHVFLVIAFVFVIIDP